MTHSSPTDYVFLTAGTEPQPTTPDEPVELVNAVFQPRDLAQPADSFGMGVTLSVRPDGRVYLTWNDLVINEWIESYDDPAVAFTRLALLLRAERDSRFFLHKPDTAAQLADDGEPGPAAFVEAAEAFLDSQLDPAADPGPTESSTQPHHDAIELRELLKTRAHDLDATSTAPGRFRVDLQFSELTADEVELLRRTVEPPL